MRRAHRLLAGLLTAGALLTASAGCAQSVDPIERLGRKAAQHVRPSPGDRARPAAVRGDHGAPGAMVVVACGRPAAGGAGTRPPVHWWPERPGEYGGEAAGAGCARR
ncbi:hypothetical protein [Streptomyces sp. NPDC091416]|uniref:hypothetical protein n=1 Tax=Streptomyces sp. NPDC091416 TaxID=3366003 RepID=UPI0038185770